MGLSHAPGATPGAAPAAEHAAHGQVQLDGSEALGREALVGVDVQIEARAGREVVIDRRGRRAEHVDAEGQHEGERQVRVHVEDRAERAIAEREPLAVTLEPGQPREVVERLVSMLAGAIREAPCAIQEGRRAALPGVVPRQRFHARWKALGLE